MIDDHVAASCGQRTGDHASDAIITVQVDIIAVIGETGAGLDGAANYFVIKEHLCACLVVP
ncbi:hypothetical protein [Arthrobacter sp. B1805]|uniref:hypothetical protein n=1 Tax=Arthrobacter sp. B1805 TaxID=2058892 RepID=UPI000CE3773A|nr:hypothetical protein [Arthrobacter sp. B1805]